MTSSFAITFFAILLLLDFPRCSQTHPDFHGKSHRAKGKRNLDKRSVLTFPPDSLLQITMGISLAGQLERNSAAVVLAFQQNAPLLNETQPLVPPSLVVAGRGFSVYRHLRDVIASYGFSGTECLRKMICQVGETPLLGGLLEDVITFVLSPSRHRSVSWGQGPDDIDHLLRSERLGKLGGNCSSAFPECRKTPLDFISAFVNV